MKVAVVVGTRPEIIKMAPIIRELKDFYVIHTGQHYDYDMDEVFFEQLKLEKPRYRLDVGSCLPGEQLAKIISGTEKVLQIETPDIILSHSDTNTSLGAALAGVKAKVKVGHVESGLRSYDMMMPEEVNRILVDHCSDILFTPTFDTCSHLIDDGISIKLIQVVGNTIVDAVYQNLELATEGIDIGHKPYALVTLHRQENVDDPKRFADIMEGLNLVSKKLNLVCIYPIHPRSEKMMKRFSIAQGDVVLMPPRDFFSFLCLEKNAKVILTDSGGIQEEACIMGVPCVTLRDNTERPEAVKVGANRVAGTNPQNILKCATEALNSVKGWKNPYGDGHSGERIVKILEEKYGK
jgi:UDP-N-acetylglucosamine 2-epimerase (non-hydrolysing)